MKEIVIKVIRARGVFGLYLVNFIFQKILRITSDRVFCMHFTNVISSVHNFCCDIVAGSKLVYLAVGDAVYSTSEDYIQLYDDTTLLSTLVNRISGHASFSPAPSDLLFGGST